MIRIVLADDQTLVRSGFRMMLEQHDDLVVVGEAADGLRAVDLAAGERPDVVLMDIRMPILDGIEATRRILDDPAAAGPRVLVLTTFDVDEYVLEALRVGASGYLLKDVEPEELVRAVRQVAVGDMPLAPVVLDRLVRSYVEHEARPLDPRVDRLSSREREVLGLLGRGFSNQEICAALFVSLPTTKTHVASILAKLDLRDRLQAAVFAHEHHLAGGPTAPNG